KPGCGCLRLSCHAFFLRSATAHLDGRTASQCLASNDARMAGSRRSSPISAAPISAFAMARPLLCALQPTQRRARSLPPEVGLLSPHRRPDSSPLLGIAYFIFLVMNHNSEYAVGSSALSRTALPCSPGCTTLRT